MAPASEPILSMSLLGPFALFGAGGERIAVTSKRGQALLALLATSGRGERTRGWLQNILWCDRAAEQAKSSLRRELSNLRKQLNRDDHQILLADSERVWLDLSKISIDIREPSPTSGQDFLEGLDIPGEEAFEDWLRDQRARMSAQSSTNTADRQVAAPRGGSPIDPTKSFAKRPAIAVLPLRIQPPDSQLEFAAHGIGESLINRLSRLRWLPVIAKSSSFSVETQGHDLREIGNQLGARYIVEGSIRGGPSPHMLATNLTDAENGQILWSETLTIADLGEPEAIETLLNGITATLGHQVDQNEQRRAVQKQSGDLSVTELIWRAKWHFSRLTPDGMEEAEKLLALAASRSPNSPEVLIELAWLDIRRLWLERGTDEQIRAARKAAQKAILADHEDARGHLLAGIAEFWLRQPLRAEGLLRRAVELDPSLVMAHAQLGSALHHKGAYKEGIAALERAKQLSPNDFDLFYIEGELAMAHLGARQFIQAVTRADASLSRRAAYWSAHVAKINALIGLGQMDEAAAAYGDLRAMQPSFKTAFINWLPYLDVTRNDALRAGLNHAAEIYDRNSN